MTDFSDYRTLSWSDIRDGREFGRIVCQRCGREFLTSVPSPDVTEPHPLLVEQVRNHPCLPIGLRNFADHIDLNAPIPEQLEALSVWFAEQAIKSSRESK